MHISGVIELTNAKIITIMRIGWRQFIKSKLQRKSGYAAVGISLSIDTASFCALKRTRDGHEIALYHETPMGDWPVALAKWTNRNKIGNAQCAVSFGSMFYNVYQTEKPAVADDEIHQALTWTVKELTGANMVFDYFEIPAQSSGNNNINVAVVPASILEGAIDAVTKAGLQLETITVEELAVCDVLPVAEEPVMTLLQKAGEEIQLAIVKQGQLYFSRSLKGFENLGSFTVEELQMGVMDSLSVQIQRSMDYFESQLRQAPVRKILMNIEAANSEPIAAQIRELMRVDVEPFEVNIPMTADSQFPLTYQCVGAALGLLGSPQNSAEKAA